VTLAGQKIRELVGSGIALFPYIFTESCLCERQSCVSYFSGASLINFRPMQREGKGRLSSKGPNWRKIWKSLKGKKRRWCTDGGRTRNSVLLLWFLRLLSDTVVHPLAPSTEAFLVVVVVVVVARKIIRRNYPPASAMTFKVIVQMRREKGSGVLMMWHGYYYF